MILEMIFILKNVIMVIFVAIIASLYNDIRWMKDPGYESWDWSKTSLDDLVFPPSFRWGLASAAHQLDGDCTNNQFNLYENIHPAKCPPVENGPEHIKHFEDDYDLLKSVGVNSYRFSIEWSKIEPSPGKIDHQEIQQYHRMIDKLLSLNIQPYVTLFHFTLPQWFWAIGGFEKKENCVYFSRYCIRMIAEFQSKVKHWMTVNELYNWAFASYYLGEFPPMARDLDLCITVIQNVLETHCQIYQTAKIQYPNIAIGYVKQFYYIDAKKGEPINNILAKKITYLFNETDLKYLSTGSFHFKLHPLKKFSFQTQSLREQKSQPFDFFGVNFYSHVYIALDSNVTGGVRIEFNKNETPSDFLFTMYPEGLYRSCALVQSYFPNIPIYITENGVADSSDIVRQQWIVRYLYSLSKCIRDNMNIQGYFHWSFMDNYEWGIGYKARFGLFEVDYDSPAKTRKLRKSGRIYRNIIRRNTKQPMFDKEVKISIQSSALDPKQSVNVSIVKETSPDKISSTYSSSFPIKDNNDISSDLYSDQSSVQSDVDNECLNDTIIDFGLRERTEN